jgi:hypothetical protein
MPYHALVYNVLIASPSDVPEERAAARQVVNDWNAAHSESTNMVIRTIGWDTDSVPEMGDRPQALLNRQLVERADLLVAIFWTRVGSSTGVALSGTVEEIEHHRNAGKPTLIYFSSANVPHDVDLEQLSAVRAVRKHYEGLGVIQRFKDIDDFRVQFSRQLATLMAEHLGGQSRLHASARTSTENYENDSLIRTNFFELLKGLAPLLPESDSKALRTKSPLLSQILRLYFRESGRLGLTRDQILHDLAEHQLKEHVPPGQQFQRRDLLGALKRLRDSGSPGLRNLFDEALRGTLSDEQRRLLILQAAYDQDINALGFLGATGVGFDVLNEMPRFVAFLKANFPGDPEG